MFGSASRTGLRYIRTRTQKETIMSIRKVLAGAFIAGLLQLVLIGSAAADLTKGGYVGLEGGLAWTANLTYTYRIWRMLYPVLLRYPNYYNAVTYDLGIRPALNGWLFVWRSRVSSSSTTTATTGPARSRRSGDAGGHRRLDRQYVHGERAVRLRYWLEVDTVYRLGFGDGRRQCQQHSFYQY